MELFKFLPLYCLATVSHITAIHNFDDYELNDEFVFVADDHNNMRRVYNSEEIDEDVVKTVNNDNHIVYYLYTRENPYIPEVLVYNNEKSIDTSNFDPDKVTVFIIHGWLGNMNSTINTLLTEAFLQDDDVNVIVIDWCEEVCSHNYFTTIASVPSIGRHVGQFILWLKHFGVSLANIHLVGHSLGAHVAGHAGRETKAKIKRITGLDPAGPLWEKSRLRLTKSDAQYVEIIHTNSKCLGYKYLNGDADFFPNGGDLMPGCIGSICSHSRSYHYMADTVKYNRMYGRMCDSMNHVQFNICEGEPYLMGNSDLSKNGSGVFIVDTNNGMENDQNLSFEPPRRRTPYRRFVNYLRGYDCMW